MLLDGRLWMYKNLVTYVAGRITDEGGESCDFIHISKDHPTKKHCWNAPRFRSAGFMMSPVCLSVIYQDERYGL